MLISNNESCDEASLASDFLVMPLSLQTPNVRLRSQRSSHNGKLIHSCRKAKATITKAQLVKAVEIFKDKAKDPEQELYAIHGCE